MTALFVDNYYDNKRPVRSKTRLPDVYAHLRLLVKQKTPCLPALYLNAAASTTRDLVLPPNMARKRLLGPDEFPGLLSANRSKKPKVAPTPSRFLELPTEILSQIILYVLTVPDPLSNAAGCSQLMARLFPPELSHVNRELRDLTRQLIQENIMWTQVLLEQTKADRLQTADFNGISTVPTLFQDVPPTTPSVRVELRDREEKSEEKYSQSCKNLYHFPFDLDSFMRVCDCLIELKDPGDFIRFQVASNGRFSKYIDHVVIPTISLQNYFTGIEMLHEFDDETTLAWHEMKEATFSYVDDLATFVDSHYMRNSLEGDLICLYAKLPTSDGAVTPDSPRRWISATLSALRRKDWLGSKDNMERIRRLQVLTKVVEQARAGYCRITMLPRYGEAFAAAHSCRHAHIHSRLSTLSYWFLDFTSLSTTFVIGAFENALRVSYRYSDTWDSRMATDTGLFRDSDDAVRCICWAAFACLHCPEEPIFRRLFCSLVQTYASASISVAIPIIISQMHLTSHERADGTLRQVRFIPRGLADYLSAVSSDDSLRMKAHLLGNVTKTYIPLGHPALDRCYENCGRSCSFFEQTVERKVLPHFLDHHDERVVCHLRSRLRDIEDNLARADGGQNFLWDERN